jgi:hypothetical protein
MNPIIARTVAQIAVAAVTSVAASAAIDLSKGAARKIAGKIREKRRPRITILGVSNVQPE